MKIENRMGKNKCDIDLVEIGEMFRHDCNIFIKTEDEDHRGCLCVDLETGEIYFFCSGEIVEIVTGTLMLD